MNPKVRDKLDSLMEQKERFTEKEKAFLKKHYPKSRWLIKYALFRQHSPQGKYVCFIIDTMPNQERKGGIQNLWDIIDTRPICNTEYEELIENLGCNNRRYEVWYYKAIEQLIEADKRYDIDTPEIFIKACKDKICSYC